MIFRKSFAISLYSNMHTEIPEFTQKKMGIMLIFYSNVCFYSISSHKKVPFNSIKYKDFFFEKKMCETFNCLIIFHILSYNNEYPMYE